jgi:flagellar hook-associated protein 2
MASITSLGTGSGLQLESLISKLMTVESVPLTTLKTRESSYQTKVSAMGSLRSTLASLQTAANGITADILQKATDKFASYTATLANTNVASATASSGAVAGTYSLEVSTLAKAQQLQVKYASSSAVVSTAGGTLKLDLGSLDSGGAYQANSGQSYDITLSAGATLANVRDAINSSAAGVTAAIVNGTDGSYLTLTSKEGTNNLMRLSGISGFSYDPATTGTGARDLTQTTPAGDAAFTLNGIAATSHNNTVTDALDGVTLQLTGTNVGAATTLSITQDIATNLTKSLQAFVTAYNTANSTMSTLGAYDPTSKASGDLQGNSTLRLAQSMLRKTITDTTSGNATSTYQRLSSIGVTISDSGGLQIDSTKLNAALKADPTTVSNLISNVGAAFNTTIDNLTNTTGPITIASNGLSKTVKSIQDQESKLQDRITAIEKRYRAQFTALDTLISSLNTTASYLTSYTASLTSSSK